MRDASAESPVVVIGASGHIGSAVVRGLLDRRVPVRAVTRSPRTADELRASGADAVVGDLLDPATLDRALATAGPVRVFALNPPGPVTGDPDAAEGATGAAIAAGLSAADVERVVALSTCGARAGERIGDLGTLHRFETLLRALPAPVAVLRAGYLYSNWDGAAEPARDGRLPVMLHPDRPLPMVSPVDVAREAVRLLTLPVPSRAVHCSEGPERLSPADVAEVFARALGRPVRVDRTREEDWPAAFEAAGFSPEAVRSFVGLTAAVDRQSWDLDGEPARGGETLTAYVERLLA